MKGSAHAARPLAVRLVRPRTPHRLWSSCAECAFPPWEGQALLSLQSDTAHAGPTGSLQGHHLHRGRPQPQRTRAGRARKGCATLGLCASVYTSTWAVRLLRVKRTGSVRRRHMMISVPDDLNWSAGNCRGRTLHGSGHGHAAWSASNSLDQLRYLRARTNRLGYKRTRARPVARDPACYVS